MEFINSVIFYLSIVGLVFFALMCIGLAVFFTVWKHKPITGTIGYALLQDGQWAVVLGDCGGEHIYPATSRISAMDAAHLVAEQVNYMYVGLVSLEAGKPGRVLEPAVPIPDTDTFCDARR